MPVVDEDWDTLVAEKCSGTVLVRPDRLVQDRLRGDTPFVCVEQSPSDPHVRERVRLDQNGFPGLTNHPNDRFLTTSSPRREVRLDRNRWGCDQSLRLQDDCRLMTQSYAETAKAIAAGMEVKVFRTILVSVHLKGHLPEIVPADPA